MKFGIFFPGDELNRVTVSDLPSIYTDVLPFLSDKCLDNSDKCSDNSNKFSDRIPDDSEIVDLVLEVEQQVSDFVSRRL